jgi:hypothetical protein
MILDTERVVMEPREFAGSMTRLVDYAADIVEVGYALQCIPSQSSHAHISHLLSMGTPQCIQPAPWYDVPLRSVPRNHKLDIHTSPALTCQTRVCKPRRSRFYMHPCKRSMTILIPTIPRPRGGHHHRGKLSSGKRHNDEPSEDFSEITLAMDGETEHEPMHEYEDTHDEEQDDADAETRLPPSREERNKRVIPWPSLAPPDLSKALSAGVIGFDGSREDFDNFNVHLAFYLDSVGFILQQARQVYDTLSFTDKDGLVVARRTFINTYGLVGLKTAHHDCLRIFEFIFTKFPHTKGLVRLNRIMAANNSADKQGASLIWNDIMTHFNNFHPTSPTSDQRYLDH